MKQVGKRLEQPMTAVPSGAALASNMAFSSDIAKLAGGRVFFPKGVFRYRSHDQANAHQMACLAVGMAQLAKDRSHG